jgi:hypothetical protein
MAPAQLTLDDMAQVASSKVARIIKHVLLVGNIAASQVELPKVEVRDDQASSHYDTERNTIVFQTTHLNSLSTYGEEIFHWLRNQLKPPAEKSDMFLDLTVKKQHAVEEFFGFVGRSVVHELNTRHLLEGFDPSCRIGFSSDTIVAIKESNNEATTALTLWSPENRSCAQSIARNLRDIETTLSNRQLNGALIHFKLLTLTATEWEESLGQATPEHTPPTHPVQMLRYCAQKFCQEFPEALIDELRLKANEQNNQDTPRTAGDERVNTWASLSGKLATIFENRLASWDTERQRLTIYMDSADKHVPGYAAGHRFLQREPHADQAIFKLLAKPSIDIYMTQIYQPPEKTGEQTPLSKAYAFLTKNFDLWRERRRLQAEAKQEKARRKLARMFREMLS